MTHQALPISSLHPTRASTPSGFFQREEGAVTIFACFMIFIMVLIGGIGVDLMRHEMERTRLQAISDTAVLAAANLNNTADPETVVQDYFAKAGVSDTLSSIHVDETDTGRSVTVRAGMDMKTQFMDFMGVGSINVPALSAAEQSVPNVEISLVLDISGSMRFSNRMDDLRPAATGFIDTVLRDEVAPHTSVTLVPYAGQTNPGPFMFSRLNGQRTAPLALDESLGGIPETMSHGMLPADDEGGSGTQPGVRYVYPNISSCIDIGTDGFASTALPAGALYPQTAHFMNWRIAADVMDWGWCPQDQTSIQYMSNDRPALNNLINNMAMHDGTGTHYAMKWAVSMLDPSSRDDVAALAGAGLASPEFANRPSGYDDASTLKYIVLMTDGQITQQVRPTDALDLENPTVELGEGRGSDRTTLTSAAQNVASFFDQCDLAKSRSPRPIVVYTIAFEAPGVPEQQMRECASSPSHFFTADGDNIADVFDSIARQIHQLRLTQ